MSWSGEIIEQVTRLQVAAWPRWLAASAGVLALGLVRRRFPRLGGAAGWLAVLAALGVGLREAWRIRWLGDDAFISFAYSQRFAEGDGLVLNLGDRVEGYTNFLWVLVLGVLRWLGASIPPAAIWLDLAAFAVLVLTASRAVAPTRSVPIAALAVALGRPFTTFATSGLETMPALALAAVAALSWQRGNLRRSGVIFALAAMMRPDHLLLAGAAWVVEGASSLMWHGPVTAMRRLIRFAAPTLVIFSAYWAWRWNYYGDFVPNTFHAKSGGGAYWEQGVVYITHAVMASGVWLSLPLAVVASLLGVRRLSSAQAYAIAVALTHGLYLTRVGGDFMEFRFMLPTLYFAFLALDGVLAPWLVSRWAPARWVGAPLVALVVGLWVVNARPIGPGEKKWHLAAEESFYALSTDPPYEPLSHMAGWGHKLVDVAAAVGHELRTAYGCVGMVAYYSRQPIIDTYGLANRRIAQRPISSRGRPGHEKVATTEDLVAERVDLSEQVPWPEFEKLTHATLNGLDLHVMHHQPELEAAARAKGWRYPDVDGWIQQELSVADAPRLRRDRDFLETWLGASPGARERLARIDGVVSGDGLDPAVLDDGVFALALRRAESLGLEPLRAELLRRVKFRAAFDDDASTPVDLGGLGPVVRGAIGNQSPVTGGHGAGLLNTYQRGDATTGEVTFALPAGEKLRLEALVGGGSDCARTALVLRDGAREIARWCGLRSETLGAVAANLEGLVQPTLTVIDTSTDSWGHLLVDDVIVFEGR